MALVRSLQVGNKIYKNYKLLAHVIATDDTLLDVWKRMVKGEDNKLILTEMGLIERKDFKVFAAYYLTDEKAMLFLDIKNKDQIVN